MIERRPNKFTLDFWMGKTLFFRSLEEAESFIKERYGVVEIKPYEEDGETRYTVHRIWGPDLGIWLYRNLGGQKLIKFTQDHPRIEKFMKSHSLLPTDVSSLGFIYPPLEEIK